MIITKPEFTPKRATAYFGSILLILMLTDLIKILLAKRIGQALKSLYIIYIKKVGGILLIISGIVLLYRVYNA
jgi:putative Mn2+ efflux pump MntP